MRIFRVALFLIPAVLTCITGGQAQMLSAAAFQCPFGAGEVVPDQLDPAGYYPIEVGDLWEFELNDGAVHNGFRTEEILSREEVGDTLFFDVAVRFYVPIDEGTFERWPVSIRRRGIIMGEMVWLGSYSSGVWENHLRLDAPFNSCFASSNEPVVAVEGELDVLVVVEEDTLHVPAIKRFEHPDFGVWYAHGIGPIGGWSEPNFDTSVIHMKVGDEEYGTSLHDRGFTFVSIEEHEWLVQRPSLGQNYPNPFNPATVIPFALPEAGYVTLTVYDLLGQEVATLVSGMMPAGAHTASFDAANVATGIYLYRLSAGSFSATRRMSVVR